MKTRAAVAFEAKKPLEIVELDLEGPKPGEVLVEIMATGICHTDAYTLDGFDSEGIFPTVLGHEGAGALAHGDAVLQAEGAHLADQAGAGRDHPLAHAMQRLQVHLLGAFRLGEAHRGPRDGLGDRGRVDGVVLVRLHVRLDELRSN